MKNGSLAIFAAFMHNNIPKLYRASCDFSETAELLVSTVYECSRCQFMLRKHQM